MKELIGKTELNMNELDQVAGGTWTVDTLTEEERAQWRALLQEGTDAGSMFDFMAAMAKINAYKAELDAKYGE